MEIQDISSVEEPVFLPGRTIVGMDWSDPIPEHPSVNAVADRPALRRKDLLDNLL